LKNLEITDCIGTDCMLMCEKHFKKYLNQISKASENGVAIIIRDSRVKGCAVCKNIKTSGSPWIGTMSKIWLSINCQESKNERR
jgi:hypothetical protein